MILQPAVLALLGSSLLVGALLAHSALWAARILRGWDLASGSERQLRLERRTHLVSTVVGYLLVFELASLFLYVFTADALAPLFTGAMCAAGSLHANRWGYPVLLLKILAFVLAGLWMVLNRADALGHDYPLLRVKYRFLLVLVPVVLLEMALQGAYFAGLRPEVITSCCGSLFGSGGRGLGSDLALLPAGRTAAAFLALLAGVLALATWFRATGRGGGALGVLSLALLPVGLAAVVAWLSPYVYELPTHHCPFCLLQREYRYVGYPLYAALLLASVAGAGVGMLVPFRRVPSLSEGLPVLQRRLASAAATGAAILGALVALLVATSSLKA